MSLKQLIIFKDLPMKLKDPLPVTPVLQPFRECENINMLNSIPYRFVFGTDSKGMSSFSNWFIALPEESDFLIFLNPLRNLFSSEELPFYVINSLHLLKLFSITIISEATGKETSKNTFQLTPEHLFGKGTLRIRTITPAIANFEEETGCLIVTQLGSLIAE